MVFFPNGSPQGVNKRPGCLYNFLFLRGVFIRGQRTDVMQQYKKY